MKLKKALSQRIKSLREAAGLSQQDVAVRGDLTLRLGATRAQGKTAGPGTSPLLALAQALGGRRGRLLDALFPPAEPEPAAEEPAAVEPAAALPEPATNGHQADGEEK